MFLQSMIKKSFVIAISILMLVLFYHLIYGNDGLIRRFILTSKIEVQQSVLESIRGERLNKEHDISLLYDNNLDVDLLEEQSRLLFNSKLNGEVQINIE